MFLICYVKYSKLLILNLSFSVSAAIDRSISSSLSDARDALVNAVVDCLAAYRANGSNIQPSGLIAPAALRLFPLYVLALLKQVGALCTHTLSEDQLLKHICQRILHS